MDGTKSQKMPCLRPSSQTQILLHKSNQKYEKLDEKQDLDVKFA